MANHGRWVAKHGHRVLLAVVVGGTAHASWRHLWRPDDSTATPVATGEACAELGELDVLDGERVAIPTTGLPHKGAAPDAARVTMLECSDFECPFSRRASGTVDELLARNDDLAFFHIHFPLGMFEHSTLKALASVAAQRQGRFWEMHDALYDARIESDEDAVELARRLRLDTVRFAADLRAPAVRAEVDRPRALCKNAGVRAVPTFFVNGRRVVGSIPADQFQRVIDDERR
jgi:protein-disulfide isomerase